ncbi:hypothetical protein ACHAXR_012183 [Thalassiosira sp. AJA248-18]
MMRRPLTTLLKRQIATSASKNQHERPSFGFSGAGFLGCYHVGAAACLHRQGWLPHPDDDSYNNNKMPLITGVSAGSMIAAATLAGVQPEPDGMEVVLEAARRTRALSLDNKDSILSLDALTPGFSLIDQVEGPFREALVKALGGYCEKDQSNNTTIHDIDPELFSRRFPDGSLRIGLTDRRELWPPPLPIPVSRRLLNAYRYVDQYRSVEDVIACSMLSSYIPGITGPLNLKDKVPDFLRGLMNSGVIDKGNNTVGFDASDRAGFLLKEMTQLGLVKHGTTGLPIVEDTAQVTNNEESNDDANKEKEPTHYWDGGIADVFPTFDDSTVVVTPLNGLFPNPSISPKIPDSETDATISDEGGADDGQQKQSSQLTALLQNYLPATFRHCPKSELGLNSKNAQTALKMIFSSDDDELYLRFREGYDDARRFLDESGQLRVFSG